MNNVPAIESIGLRKTYRSGLFKRSGFEALKGIDFKVNQGEIFGLLGPNGAGKTTFVKVLLGVIHKSGGTAKILGREAGTQNSRKEVGYLPESLRIRGHHTAISAMRYYGQLSGLSISTIKTREKPLLELVGLADRTKEGIRQFSKGMLQRLGLAQALLHEPKILMLDEPTDGLDPRARAEMRTTMIRLRNEGKTIFLNSHILQEVEMVCDRVAILDRGVLKYCGAVKDVGKQLTNQRDQQSWQVEIEVGGDTQRVKGVLAEYPVDLFEPADPQTTRIQLRLQDQAAVDRIVDQIRGANLSLVSLSKAKISLETAFLQLLDENRQPAHPAYGAQPVVGGAVYPPSQF
jgi:ABC-2 type transport system ATP-binding protein